jgi:hypothetical protein
MAPAWPYSACPKTTYDRPVVVTELREIVMTDPNGIETLIGRTAFDSDGDKIGKIGG